MFYAMAAILHPLNSPLVPRFDDIRAPFYVVFILYGFVELLVLYVRDGNLTLDYLIIGQLYLLAGIGIYIRKTRFDQLFAAWNLFVCLAFQFFARSAG
jgi:predicted membrane channel-forming protein YqfA (hemolysin III family)